VRFGYEILTILGIADIGADNDMSATEMLIEAFKQIDAPGREHQPSTGPGELFGEHAANSRAGARDYHRHILKRSCHGINCTA
jgi:hypothetical protein